MTHELKSLQGQRDKTRQIINTYEEDIKKKNLLMIKFLLVLMISYMKELIHFHIL